LVQAGARVAPRFRSATPRGTNDRHARARLFPPHSYVSQVLSARADQQIVRFYDRGVLIKTHPRKAPGGRSIDAQDYPVERSTYALRDVQGLQRQAAIHGEAIGRFAAALLDNPLPWTRMRRVYALLGLARRYGAARVNEVCATALAADMFEVPRLERMLAQATAPSAAVPPARSLPLARFLRPASRYALPLASHERPSEKREDIPWPAK
jgi:hypothetical protein